MTVIQPGVCRHCNCTEEDACRLETGDSCGWTNRERTVCSNPSCIKAEADRVAKAKAVAKAAEPRKLRSWEINQLIRRGNRKPRKGRAA